VPKKAYTLIELTISIAILSTVIVAAMTTFSNIVNSRQRLTGENYLYNESRLVIEQLIKVIRTNVIDYSEYYNQNVLPADKNPFGANYDVYATRFIDPAEACDDLNDGENTIYSSVYDPTLSDLGGCCYKSSTMTYHFAEDAACDGADVEATNVGKDSWSGENPYSATSRYNVDIDDSNAFCDDDEISKRKCSDLSPSEIFANDKLYLISTDGRKKTIFITENVEYKDEMTSVVSFVEMDGSDSTSDALLDQWACNNYFDCTSSDTPNKEDFADGHTESDLAGYFDDFVPISPFALKIDELKFYISPTEDLNLAYTEKNAQKRPSVTIILKTSLADTTGMLGGENVNLTLQTTVTPQYEEVKSYRIE
jgi:prepilin-type N-terminal cleavage/methylation domain-containing protein